LNVEFIAELLSNIWSGSTSTWWIAG